VNLVDKNWCSGFACGVFVGRLAGQKELIFYRKELIMKTTVYINSIF
jgi:hypothetical protein